MKAIFTYPNNELTNWVDPTYYGSVADGTGYTYRVSEYIAGDYIGGVRIPAGVTQDDFEQFLGKYFNYIDNVGGNYLSRYGWVNPVWVEGEWREHEFVVDYIDVDRANVADPLTTTITMNEIVGTAWGSNHYHTFSTGDTVYWESLPLFNDSSATIDSDTASSVTVNKYPDKDDSVDNTATKWHRQGDGCWARYTGVEHGFSTGDRVHMTFGFDEAHDTGTASQVATDFWVEAISDYTLKLFTDSGRTTEATLNEVYYDTFTVNYTNTTGGDLTRQLEFIDYSTASQAFQDGANNDETGWCRVTYTVNAGSVVAEQSGSSVPITTTLSYTNTFYWFKTPFSNLINIDDFRGSGSHQADFTMADGSDVDITIHLINPARGATGNKYHLMQGRRTGISESRTSPYGDANKPYYLYDTHIIQQGNRNFRYYIEDPLNPGERILEDGAVLSNNYYNPGDASFTGWTGDEKPEITVNLDVDAKLETLIITDGGEISYSDGVANPRRAILFNDAASDYIPPGPSAVELEDSFDTNDEWDGSTNANSSRVWPTHVSPRSLEVNVLQPSSITRSQNGTKYVKQSGIVRYQIELSYPAMDYDDFIKFQRVIEGARGQAVPFYLKLRDYDNGLNMLFNSSDYGTLDDVVARSAGSANRPLAGQKVFLLDGFPSNYSGSREGHHVIFGANGNGNIHILLNDVESNVFGESKIRLAKPIPTNLNFHQAFYQSPFWAVVTLADDNFSFNKSLEGLYTFSVTFDLDEWK